jgi:hypothetical protein
VMEFYRNGIPHRKLLLMGRWFVTFSVTIVMLGNIALSVQCAAAGVDSNIADCCKDGMCPHHLSGAETQSCPHTLSDASLSLILVNMLPATVNGQAVDPIQLEPIGTADEMLVPRIIEVVIFPFTPPPEL